MNLKSMFPYADTAEASFSAVEAPFSAAEAAQTERFGPASSRSSMFGGRQAADSQLDFSVDDGAPLFGNSDSSAAAAAGVGSTDAAAGGGMQPMQPLRVSSGGNVGSSSAQEAISPAASELSVARSGNSSSSGEEEGEALTPKPRKLSPVCDIENKSSASFYHSRCDGSSRGGRGGHPSRNEGVNPQSKLSLVWIGIRVGTLLSVLLLAPDMLLASSVRLPHPASGICNIWQQHRQPHHMLLLLLLLQSANMIMCTMQAAGGGAWDCGAPSTIGDADGCAICMDAGVEVRRASSRTPSSNFVPFSFTLLPFSFTLHKASTMRAWHRIKIPK